MPGDRYIELQPDATVVDPLDDKEEPRIFTHRKVIMSLLRSVSFGENMTGVLSAQEILARLRDLPPDATHLRLTDEDWKPLAAACDMRPALLLNIVPLAMGPVVPMLEAITKASKEPPKKPEPAPEVRP